MLPLVLASPSLLQSPLFLALPREPVLSSKLSIIRSPVVVTRHALLRDVMMEIRYLQRLPDLPPGVPLGVMDVCFLHSHHFRLGCLVHPLPFPPFLRRFVPLFLAFLFVVVAQSFLLLVAIFAILVDCSYFHVFLFLPLSFVLLCKFA